MPLNKCGLINQKKRKGKKKKSSVAASVDKPVRMTNPGWREGERGDPFLFSLSQFLSLLSLFLSLSFSLSLSLSLSQTLLFSNRKIQTMITDIWNMLCLVGLVR